MIIVLNGHTATHCFWLHKLTTKIPTAGQNRLQTTATSTATEGADERGMGEADNIGGKDNRKKTEDVTNTKGLSFQATGQGAPKKHLCKGFVFDLNKQ